MKYAIFEATPNGVFREKLAKRFMHPATAAESVSFTIKEYSRYIVNVGSVGYSRNDLCCTYGIYDDTQRRMTIRRLPFDFKSYINDMLAHRTVLPGWLLRLLRAAQSN